MPGARSILIRNLRRAWGRGASAGIALVFFVLVAVLFPFITGPDAALLRRLSPGVVWVSALLAALLSLDRLFDEDLADGTIDQLRVNGMSWASISLVKLAGHWFAVGIPLFVAGPFVALAFGCSSDQSFNLLASLVVGMPVLSAIGGFTAAATAGLGRGGALTGLLALPLLIPVLIFGVAAANAEPGALAFLGAFSLLSVAGAPFATAAALRLAAE